MMSRLATAGYFVCWALAAAVTALLCGASLRLAALLHRGYPASWIDDDWTLFMISASALVGLIVAWRTRESSRLHTACRVLGLIVALVGITISIIFALRAGAALETDLIPRAVDGVVALFFGVYATIGILAMGIGGFGAAGRRQSPSGE